MKITRFEEIIAWQKGKELTVLLYQLLKELKDYSFKDQILRAAVSIPNNIAEGFERNTDKELKYFLYIAKGSSAEVRSMLLVGLDLKYFFQKDFEKCYNLSSEVSKLLSGFIKTL